MPPDDLDVRPRTPGGVVDAFALPCQFPDNAANAINETSHCRCRLCLPRQIQSAEVLVYGYLYRAQFPRRNRQDAAWLIAIAEVKARHDVPE